MRPPARSIAASYSNESRILRISGWRYSFAATRALSWSSNRVTGGDNGRHRSPNRPRRRAENRLSVIALAPPSFARRVGASGTLATGVARAARRRGRLSAPLLLAAEELLAIVIVMSNSNRAIIEAASGGHEPYSIEADDRHAKWRLKAGRDGGPYFIVEILAKPKR